MRKFEYFAPQSLSEALAVFQEQGEGGRALASAGIALAVFFAIADAVGAPGWAGRLHEVPATPERILKALGSI